MIGMSFWTFVVLLAAGVVAAAVLHYVIRYRLLEGFDGLIGKVIALGSGGSDFIVPPLSPAELAHGIKMAIERTSGSIHQRPTNLG
jgi:hypothetical protein